MCSLQHLILLFAISFALSNSLLLDNDDLLRADPTRILGNSVYLPRTNVFDEHIDGRHIFQDISQAWNSTESASLYHDNNYFESTKSFYSFIAVESNVGGNYGAVSASLSTTLKSISGGQEKIRALAVNAVTRNKLIKLDKEKLSKVKLNPLFLSELEGLKTNVTKPSEATSWAPFRRFLAKWGSHFVSGYYTGSMVQQWSTSKESNNYNQDQFTARACLKVEGMKAAMDGCVGVSTESKTSASRLQMNDKMYIKGGTAATRAKLDETRTKELISKFMKEGANSTIPVQYLFTPVWEIIFQRFSSSTPEWQIAKNLWAYYDGFKGFNCEKKTTQNNRPLQYFAAVTDDSGTRYQCRRACEGCKDDNDCHIGGWGSVCYCYGQSCIVTNSETGRAEVRTSSSGSYYEGVNNSCHYRVGVTCGCERYNDDAKCERKKENGIDVEFAVLWDQETSNALPGSGSGLALIATN